MTDFASGLDVGGATDQFGRKLANDFVQNNQGKFGAWGWMADKLAPYAQGYDGSTPNGQFAAATVLGATLATPGGGAKGAKPFAMGLTDEGLEAFAQARGATTWKQLPHPENWKAGVMDKLADPKTPFTSTWMG